MLKVIDLFSGIGGFALGLESTGYFKTVQFVENEKWCQQILAKNFPGVPIHDDIKTYNTYQGVEADVVVGGFPCQPFSVAGKGKAVQDDRHLWPEMFRVIRQTKPTWIIGENVRNIVSISDGMVLEQVYLDLESQGYEVQSFIIPASAVNAPHQRYRTWIVAYSECNGLSTTKIGSSIKETVYEKPTRQNGTFNFKGTSSISETTKNVVDTDSRLRGGRRTIRPSGENGQRGVHTTQEEQTTHDLRSKTIRRNTVRGKTKDVADTDNSRQQEQWWQSSTQQTHQTFKCSGQWEFEPDVGRVAHGVPRRVDRLKGLGNAIVPQIAYQIGKAIRDAEEI
jgi:DNA (cytosine-5)-methyltransferase 1